MVLTLGNRLSELERLRSAVEEFGAAAGLDRRTVLEINLILEELFVNVVLHGFPAGGEHRIKVGLALRGGEIVLETTDDGLPFDPLETSLPDVGQSVEDRRVGGLGVLLVRKLADRLEHRRAGGLNVLTVTKRLKGDRNGPPTPKGE